MVNTFDVAWLKTSRYMPTTPTMMAYPNSIHWKQHTYVCIPEKASKSEQMTVSIPASMLLSLQWDINNYKLTTSCCNHCVVYACDFAWCKAFTAGFDYDSLVIRPWFVQVPYLAELIHSLFQPLRSMRDGFNIATTLVTLTWQNSSYPRKQLSLAQLEKPTQPSPTLPTVAVIAATIPPFWPADFQLWLAQVEPQLNT